MARAVDVVVALGEQAAEADTTARGRLIDVVRGDRPAGHARGQGGQPQIGVGADEGLTLVALAVADSAPRDDADALLGAGERLHEFGHPQGVAVIVGVDPVGHDLRVVDVAALPLQVDVDLHLACVRAARHGGGGQKVATVGRVGVDEEHRARSPLHERALQLGLVVVDDHDDERGLRRVGPGRERLEPLDRGAKRRNARRGFAGQGQGREQGQEHGWYPPSDNVFLQACARRNASTNLPFKAELEELNYGKSWLLSTILLDSPSYVECRHRWSSERWKIHTFYRAHQKTGGLRQFPLLYH